jgi:hypothetical protein
MLVKNMKHVGLIVRLEGGMQARQFNGNGNGSEGSGWKSQSPCRSYAVLLLAR